MVGSKCLFMEQGMYLCACIKVQYQRLYSLPVVYTCSLHVATQVKCVFP